MNSKNEIDKDRVSAIDSFHLMLFENVDVEKITGKMGRQRTLMAEHADDGERGNASGRVATAPRSHRARSSRCFEVPLKNHVVKTFR